MATHYNMNEPSDFFCTNCGNKNLLTVSRVKGQAREPGHLKRMYCFHCKEEYNHAEVRLNIMTYTYEDFREEFELGRFQDGNRIPKELLFTCSKSECPFNKNGKCWNANNSEQCKHKPMKGELENE